MPKSSKMSSSSLPAKKRKRDSGLNGELDKSNDDKGLSCPPVKKRKKDNNYVPPSVKKNGDNSVKKIGDSFKVNGVKGEEGGEKEDSCGSLTCEPCKKQFSSNTTFKYHEYFCQRTAPSEDRDKIEALLKKSKDIIEARNKAATKLVNGDASEGAASGKEAKSLKVKSLNHKLPLTSSESIKNACELTNGVNGVLVPSDEAFKKPAAETKPEFSILPSRRPERRKSVVNRFLCLLCTDKFASKADKLRHTKQVHEMEKKFPCGFCDLRFSLEIRLRRHLKVHLPD